MPPSPTDIAKMSVETYIKSGKVINLPNKTPDNLKNKKAGVFVTIEKNGNLRACIGTYIPTKENITEEIIQNAISAATEDYRFGPILEEELPLLSYIVYILEKPEKTLSLSDLDPKKYGILVKSKINPRKTGLLLPALEEINTVGEQISSVCQKSGIIPGEEPFEIYRFAAQKYH